MNCVTHTKSPAVAECDECGRPICQMCYNTLTYGEEHLCADCLKKKARSEISEINSLIGMTKREIGLIIFGFIAGLIGAIILLVINLKNSQNDVFMYILIPYLPFVLGSLMTVAKRIIRVFSSMNDGEEDSWIWALVFAIIAGWFMLMVTPIITIYRFVVRIKDKNLLNGFLARDQRLVAAIDNFIAESLKPSVVEQAAAGGDVEISLDDILASSAGSDAALCDNGEILRTIRTR